MENENNKWCVIVEMIALISVLLCYLYYFLPISFSSISLQINNILPFDIAVALLIFSIIFITFIFTYTVIIVIGSKEQLKKILIMISVIVIFASDFLSYLNINVWIYCVVKLALLSIYIVMGNQISNKSQMFNDFKATLNSKIYLFISMTILMLIIVFSAGYIYFGPYLQMDRYPGSVNRELLIINIWLIAEVILLAVLTIWLLHKKPFEMCCNSYVVFLGFSIALEFYLNIKEIWVEILTMIILFVVSSGIILIASIRQIKCSLD